MTGLTNSPAGSVAYDVSGQIARLRRRAIILLAILDVVLFPLSYYFLTIFTFQVRVEKLPYIFLMIAAPLLLFNLLTIITVYVFTRSILQFHQWLRTQPPGKADKTQINFHWNRLTRIPLRIGFATFISIFGSGEAVLILFTFLGNIFLFQVWTASCLFFWLSGIIGITLYLQTRSFLEPYYAMMAREYMIEWAGRKLGVASKVIGMVIILGILPTLYLDFASYRNAQFGLREYIVEQAELKVGQALVKLKSRPEAQTGSPELWTQEPEKWFLVQPDGTASGSVRELPDLSGINPDQVITISGRDPNRVWVAGRSGSGYLIGLEVPLSFYYPQMKKLLRILVFSTLLIFFTSIYVAFLAGRSFERPIREMRDIAQGLREKDAFLDAYLGGVSDDEIGELALAFNRLLLRIRGQYNLISSLMDEIRGMALVLSRSSDEIVELAGKQTKSVEDQVSLIENTVDTSHRFEESAESISDRARVVLGGAESTLSSCGKGVDAINQIINEISQSGEQVMLLKDQMGLLKSASEEIRKILEVVDRIARETEILALNATFEAAGAGEMGRRFSIVAQEVKRLAVKSSESVSEIGRRTRTIIEQFNLVIGTTDQAAEKVLGNVDRIRGFKQALEDLSQLANQTTQSAEAIVESTAQQNQGARTLTADLESIQAISKNLTESARRIQNTISQLRQLTDQLKQRSE